MTVFYRKYRPQKLIEIVGQDPIIETISSQLQKGKASHAYLFSGPKGTGKTTLARILAKAVNCSAYRPQTADYSKKKSSSRKAVVGKQVFGEPCNKCSSCLSVVEDSHLDVIEIDAASNRGIDDIRELRERVRLAPAQSRFKVYIIDEAHMLTTEAFNALLKTLEEPPLHTIFILCTTESHKLPETISSRCQSFSFTRAKPESISQILKKVVTKEGLEAEKEALDQISSKSQGSFRDALNFLEQIATARKKISLKITQEFLSTQSMTNFEEFVGFLAQKNAKAAVEAVNELYTKGVDLRLFCEELLSFLRKILLYKFGLQEEGDEGIRKLSEELKEKDIESLIRLFEKSWEELKFAAIPQLPLELAIVGFIFDQDEKEELEEEVLETQTIKKVNNEKSNQNNLTPSQMKQKASKTQPSPTKKPSQAQEVPKGKLSLDQILILWPQILEVIKDKNHSIVALLRSSRAVEFKTDTLTLEAFYKFHKERLSDPKIIDIIEDSIGQILGKKIKLKCVLGEKGNIQESPKTPSASYSKPPEDKISTDDAELEKLMAEILS